MAKFSFDPKPLGFTDEHDTDMSSATQLATFQPVVVFRPGIEAIIEGLRLADVQGFPPPTTGGTTDDIDP